MDAWKRKAPELTEWALSMLANRDDARGGYYRKGSEVARVTRKATDKYWTDHAAAMRKHFAAAQPDDVVGLHSTAPDNTSRWLAFDIDAHTDAANPDENLQVAIQICERLANIGYTGHIFETSGKGGVHVWVIFDQPAATERVFELGRIVLKGCRVPVETFPKQAGIPPDRFGNWLRVPGRHHTNNHWAQAWCETQWLSAEATVEYILKIEGQSTDKLPAATARRPVFAGNGQAPDLAGIKLPLSKITCDFIGNGAAEGKRNMRLFAAAADMKGNGYERGEAGERLMPAALRCGLDEPEAVATINSAYAKDRAPYVDDDGDEPAAQPAEKSPAVAPVEPPPKRQPPVGNGAAYTITNVTIVRGQDDENMTIAKTIEQICADMQAATENWPRRAANAVFVLNDYDLEGIPGASCLRFLTDHTQLFSWLHCDGRVVFWPTVIRKGARHRKSGEAMTPVSRPEFYDHLKATAEPSYVAVEVLPHSPPVPGIFYVPVNLPPATGKALEEFAESLNAETPIDRQLIIAALMTPGWGGPCGARPAFLFTSSHGRGVGKSRTAEAICEIWGGRISVSADREEWREAKSRLLSDESLAARCVLMDNLRQRIQGADIESLITAPVIDGKKMYVGQYSRPNRLTYFLTANTPRLSQDLADRSVLIKIGRKQHGNDWWTWAQNFVRDKRRDLLADIYAALTAPDECTIDLENRDRWACWQTAILQKFEDGNAIAAEIRARRPEFDADRDDAMDIRQAVEAEIRRQGYDPDNDTVVIGRPIMQQILQKHDLIDRKWSPRAATTWLMNLIGDSGELSKLIDNPHKGDFRTWLYVGSVWKEKQAQLLPIFVKDE